MESKETERFITFDSFFERIQDDVSDEWAMLHGLTVEFEPGVKFRIEFLESNSAGTKFESVRLDNGKRETLYLGHLSKRLSGVRITELGARNTRLSELFTFESDAEQRAKRQQFRKEREKERQEEKLENQVREREKRRQLDEEAAVRQLSHRLEHEAAQWEHVYQEYLREQTLSLRNHFGTAIPEDVSISFGLATCIVMTFNTPEIFRQVSEPFRSGHSASSPNEVQQIADRAQMNLKGVEREDIVTARAILELHEYIRNDRNHEKLSAVSGWWRKAGKSQIALQLTEHIHKSDDRLSSSAKVSRAAAICDVYGIYDSDDAKQMLQKAVELDRQVLRWNPNNDFAKRQLGRALTLAGDFRQGVDATREGSKGSRKNLRHEFAQILELMSKDSRRAKFHQYLYERVNAGDLDENDVPF